MLTTLADQIWAALQRPSPSVTKEEIEGIIAAWPAGVDYKMVPTLADLNPARARLAELDERWKTYCNEVTEEVKQRVDDLKPPRAILPYPISEDLWKEVNCRHDSQWTPEQLEKLREWGVSDAGKEVLQRRPGLLATIEAEALWLDYARQRRHAQNQSGTES